MDDEARGTSRESTPARWLFDLRWPLALVLLGLMALLAYRWTLRGAGQALDSAGRTVHAVGERIAEIGERFHTGTITHTFVSSIPRIHGTGSGNLELAVVEVDELLSVSDDRRILWDRISLGETVAEIRVPVTYRYHLRLGDDWRLAIDEHTCVVHAPQIRPSLPPAIDTSRMIKRSDGGWLRFNAAEQLEQLERDLTPTLVDERHLDAVREQARRTVAEFVRSWLLMEDHWREDRFRSIVVLFPDDSFGQPERIRPTLELAR